jgi:hypothetical protein
LTPKPGLDFVYIVGIHENRTPITEPLDEVIPIVHRKPIPSRNHTPSVTNQPSLALLPPISMLERAARIPLPTHPVKLLETVVLRHPLRRLTGARDLDESMHALGTAASTLACDRAWGDLEIV